MIPFFRKIRKKMADDNRPLKYMRYAIGEIVLVVVGILIALYINNWNENRLEKKEVANVLEQIKNELESDISYFNKNLYNIQDITAYLNKVSERKYDEINLSQLLYYLPINFNPKKFGLSYTKMIESGIIKHIENSHLGDKLQEYYGVNCASYSAGTEFHANFVLNHIEGPLLLILNQKKDFLVDPKEVIEEIESGKLLSFVNWQISHYEGIKPQVEENVVKAKELISLITKK